MALYHVAAKVVLEIETEFDEAEDGIPTEETVEFCLLDDIQDAGGWEVKDVKVVNFKRAEIEIHVGD